jgi:uncharacterized membrane protein
MVGGITGMVLAVLAFVGGHILFAGTPLRVTLIDLVGGEARFRGVFSLYSAVTLIWVILAYAAAPFYPVWPDARWTHWLPVIVMPFACVLLVAGLSTPNVTAVGGERAAEMPDPVPGIMKLTRHPFLWGVTMWAVSHAIANGDMASLTLFGGMAVLALGGMPSLDAKTARRLGAAWGPIAMRSSLVPFVAIINGRTSLRIGEIGWGRIAAGIALYVLLVFAHPWIAGKPVFPF